MRPQIRAQRYYTMGPFGDKSVYTIVASKIQLTKPKAMQTYFPDEKESWRSRHFGGEWFGAMNCTFIAFAVFLLNLAITINTTALEGRERAKSNTLYRSECGQIRNLNTGILLLINTLGTILQFASVPG
jgi:hypothetical protein